MDEIQRIVSIMPQTSNNCVVGPHGIRFDGNVARPATDEECRFASIDINARLRFDVSEPTAAREAVAALQKFAKDIEFAAATIGKFDAATKQATKPAKRKGKAA